MECFRKDRITIQERERNEAKAKELDIETKKQANERRIQTLKVASPIYYPTCLLVLRMDEVIDLREAIWDLKIQWFLLHLLIRH